MKIPVRKQKREAGQAILLIALATSIFLLGAVGFAIDGATLYAQRQMAQAAADAAAQAGIMSIFDGSNTSGTHAFADVSGTTYTCASSDARTPCYYAQSLNGFNNTSDTVTYIPNPTGVSVPGLSSDPINLLQVKVQRVVPTTLLQFLGSSSSTISATGTAAIVTVTSPTPIIITHPTMAGALNMNGNNSIVITGGPQRSIQINSNGTNPAGAAYSGPSSGSVNLSAAGPNGTGADFGTFGGPVNNPGNVNLGTTGHYLGQSSPIQDPLAGVAAPTTTGLTNQAPGGQSCSVLGHCKVNNVSNCPVSGFGTGTPPATCQEYLPGIYSSLDLTGVSSAFFDPGIYYIEGGGFTLKNDTVQMCQTCTQDATTKSGMVIYDTCSSGACPSTGGTTGGFTVDTNANAQLLGAGVSSSNPTGTPASPYYGILFFEDRNANAHTGNGKNGAHNIGQGNGCFSIIGTIYITNTLTTMQSSASHYQEVDYNGNPCTGVSNYGEIIVSQLTMKGTSTINMGLFPTGFLKVRQVALVN